MASTIAPDGSHRDSALNGSGSSACATAPPELALPRTVNTSQVGTRAQGPISTDSEPANADAAVICSATMSQLSAKGNGSPNSAVATVTRTRLPRTTRAPVATSQGRNGNGFAFARSWKVVRNPSNVAAIVR